MSAELAYARAGVSQGLADEAVSALVDAIRRIKLSQPTRQLLSTGHFANVLRSDDGTGIAVSTDGVGTKTLLAERMGRFETIGIDCVAMNVNDLICVGAEPIAMLDYIAVSRPDPAITRAIGEGLARGAERANIEIPGGELAVLSEVVSGFDLVGTCIGLVDVSRIIRGSSIEPDDVVIGLPSSGLHANGYTLARQVLADIPLDDEVHLGRQLGDVLLEPTEIYVRAILELLRSDVDVHGLAHITSLGLDNLTRLNQDVGYEIDNAFDVPPVFQLIQDRAGVSDDEMHEVFSMGCGFCCVVPATDEASALQRLRGHYQTARRIGRVTTEHPGEVVRLRRAA